MFALLARISSVIHFLATRSMMANLWHLVRGVQADLPQELTSTERFGTSGGLANSGPRNLEWRCRWGFRGIQITSGIFNSPKYFVAYYALPRLWVPRYPP
ncbi:hypothetical protein GOBAR_AA04434 [Gossypium barbadense]|uniref:Secreted protein n=1 Tax=Gossypium barbadense TaxID=3634 RepID=A0A2P5YKT9_GOSBA|nr:hypothetical protein GOBAR_AA04434 [Gossypium barbadense]